MQRKSSEMRRSWRGKIAFTVYFELFLVGTCLPVNTNALPMAQGPAFPAANGRNPIAGIVAYVFGGMIAAFQGDTTMTADVNVGGRQSSNFLRKKTNDTNLPKERDLSGTTPTPKPTPAPYSETYTRTYAETVDTCTHKLRIVAVDIETVPAGTYVCDEWANAGLTLSTKGGLAGEPCPRLFHTASAGTSNDPDLGFPNSKCVPAGPGTGKGGEPSGAGPNCNPLGNVLIIQNEDPKIINPDDNVNGGTIIFDFNGKAEYVGDIGLLDVDCRTLITVVWKTANGKMAKKFFPVHPLGDNSYHVFSINKPNVKQVRLKLRRSGAVSFISFCPPIARPTSPPTKPPTCTRPPTLPPTPPPSSASPAPSDSPSESPSKSPAPSDFQTAGSTAELQTEHSYCTQNWYMKESRTVHYSTTYSTVHYSTTICNTVH